MLIQIELNKALLYLTGKGKVICSKKAGRAILLIVGLILISECFSLAQAQTGKSIIRIDSHIHLYDTNREGSSTFLNPEKHSKIYYPHLAPEFLHVAKPSGVNYAVVIEASYRMEDNYWVMDVVNKSENMLAFIANLDPRDENFKIDLEKLSKNIKFRGIRIRPKNKIDISEKSTIDKLSELAIRGLILELGPNEPAEAIEKIASIYPQLKIVLNHMAGGSLQAGKIVPENWNERLEKLAALPNVYCKISALFDLSGQSPAPVSEVYYRQFIDQVVTAFGPERILFGSNWTLSEMYGSYYSLVSIYEKYIENKTTVAANKLFAENAIKIYGLKIKEY